MPVYTLAHTYTHTLTTLPTILGDLPNIVSIKRILGRTNQRKKKKEQQTGNAQAVPICVACVGGK